MPVEAPPLRFKLVAVGDYECGKSSLLIALDPDREHLDSQQPYRPSVLSPFITNLTMPHPSSPSSTFTSAATTPTSIPIELSLWDTSSSEEYARLRPLSYSESNVILICFSLTSSFSSSFHNSLEESIERWAEEIKSWDTWAQEISESEIELIVVGTKCDLEDERELGNYSDKGKWIAQQIGAYSYRECSARTLAGINELLGDILKASYISYQKRKKRKRKARKMFNRIRGVGSNCVIA